MSRNSGFPGVLALVSRECGPANRKNHCSEKRQVSSLKRVEPIQMASHQQGMCHCSCPTLSAKEMLWHIF